jgi:hypothetical protein
MTAAAMAADDAGLVRLAATMRLHADPERVVEIMGPVAGAWLGERVDRDGPGSLRRYEIDLRLRVGGEAAALTTFRKAAYLDLGLPRRVRDGWQVEIGWRASTAAPLFPVFFGLLVILPGELRIEGLYAPPGGVIGRVADRMLLHIAANGTARWLLAEIDRVAREAVV